MGLADFSLEGKRALVVGGRRNMGKGFSLGLAEAGADVAVTDLKVDDGRLQAVSDEIIAMGRESMAIQSDISSKSSVDALISKVLRSFGRIDILMNVAVMYHRKSLIDLDEEGWDQLTNVNLKGYWLMHQAVAPVMQSQGGGSIINLSSRGGLKAHADKGMGNYAIMKAGIAMMTRQYSRYLGPDNVRVNALAPSLVFTERIRNAFQRKKLRGPIQPNLKNLRPGRPALKTCLWGELLVSRKWPTPRCFWLRMRRAM